MSDNKYMDEIKAALGELVEPVTARLDAIEDTQKETKAQVEDLLARPVNEPVITGGDGGEYRGYQLKSQGRDLVAKGILAAEDRDKVAKFAIDFVKGAVFNKPEAKAAMQEGTDAEGGYLVPEEWGAAMLAYGLLNSFALTDCNVIPMKHRIMNLPAELTRPTVAWTAEESDATESEPTFAEVQLTAKRLDGYSIASNELLEDEAYDLVGWLTAIFGEAIGQELDNQVLNGTGDPCSGVLTAAAGQSVVMASGSTAFSNVTADHLSEMISKLAVNKVTNPKFYMHRTVRHFLRTLKDSNGAYIYDQPTSGDAGYIWGYPIVLTEKAPSTSGAATAFLVFGDMKHFALGQRLGDMSLAVDPYGKFISYQTRFRVVTRWGLGIGLSGGFCRLLTAAS